MSAMWDDESLEDRLRQGSPPGPSAGLRRDVLAAVERVLVGPEIAGSAGGLAGGLAGDLAGDLATGPDTGLPRISEFASTLVRGRWPRSWTLAASLTAIACYLSLMAAANYSLEASWPSGKAVASPPGMSSREVRELLADLPSREVDRVLILLSAGARGGWDG